MTCGVVNEYEIDTAIRLSGLFENVDLGVAADPLAVTLYIEDPTGSTTVLGMPPITRDGTGAYSYLLVPSLSGTWIYKWRGVGNVIATSPDTIFVVNPSFVIAG